MTGPTDDQLRAMLEARADRGRADADATMRALRPMLVTSRSTRHLAKRLPLALLAAAAGVMLVVGAGLSGVAPWRSIPAATPPGQSPAASFPAVASSVTPPASSPAMSLADLVDGVSDGSLNGRLVTIEGGRLRVVAVPCPSPGNPVDCMSLSLEGVPGASVRLDARTVSWAQPSSEPGLLVFRVMGRTLVYLGRSVVPLDRPQSVDQLIRVAYPGDGIVPAGAWLHDVGLDVCTYLYGGGPGSDTCTHLGRLSDSEAASGNGISVHVDPGGLLTATPRLGRYLLRVVPQPETKACNALLGAACVGLTRVPPDPEAPWQLLADLDAEDVVNVTAP